MQKACNRGPRTAHESFTKSTELAKSTAETAGRDSQSGCRSQNPSHEEHGKASGRATRRQIGKRCCQSAKGWRGRAEERVRKTNDARSGSRSVVKWSNPNGPCRLAASTDDQQPTFHRGSTATTAVAKQNAYHRSGAESQKGEAKP